MSYEILYNKQFIKVEDNKFIVMVETGSNNCYDVGGRGRGRRARSWYADKWMMEYKQFASKEEILSKIESVRAEKIESGNASAESYKDDSYIYDDKNFGWHMGVTIYGKRCGTTTFNDYKNFYLTGIKQAMTIEELLERDVKVNIHLYFYKKEDVTKLDLKIKPDVTITSTQHLLDTLAEWREYYNQCTDRIHIGYESDWRVEQLKKYRAKLKPKKDRQYKTVNEFYVLESETGYFVRNTARGYKYSPYNSGGKAFIDEKSAARFQKRMRNKDIFKITKINLGDFHTATVRV